MTIGILTISIFIPDAASLKDKRRVLKSLKERVRNSFNISIAEADYHDKWQRAEMMIACVSTDKKNAQSQLCKIIDFINGFNKAQLLDSKMEFI